jgi:hypothetical protein
MRISELSRRSPVSSIGSARGVDAPTTTPGQTVPVKPFP